MNSSQTVTTPVRNVGSSVVDSLEGGRLTTAKPRYVGTINTSNTSSAKGKANAVDTSTIIVSAVVGVLLVLVGTVGALLLRRKRKIRQARDHKLRIGICDATLDQAIHETAVALRGKLERPSALHGLMTAAMVDRAIVTVTKVSIGAGVFGTFYRGSISTPNQPGKAQTMVLSLPRTGAAVNQTIGSLAQVALYKVLVHPQLLRIEGLVHDAVSTMILFEPCIGSLSILLEQSQQGNAHPINCDEIRVFAHDVVAGMAYLEHSNIVLGDLCVDNIFVIAGTHSAGGAVDAGKRTPARNAKVGLSFALARMVSPKAVEIRKSTRHLSPQRLISNEPSAADDVWSFGVCLWEMYSAVGSSPEFAINNASLNRSVTTRIHLNGVSAGLGRPPACPDGPYWLMKRCWNLNTFARPTFAAILAEYMLEDLPDAASIVSEMRACSHVPPRAHLAEQSTQAQTDSVRAQSWNIKRDSLIPFRQLGEGEFGLVYLAVGFQLPGARESSLVAAKVLRSEGAEAVGGADSDGPTRFGDYKHVLTSPTAELQTAVGAAMSGAVDSELRRNFVAESKVMRQLDHPNLVRLLGVCFDADPLVIIMEYLPGGDLLSWYQPWM